MNPNKKCFTLINHFFYIFYFLNPLLDLDFANILNFIIFFYLDADRVLGDAVRVLGDADLVLRRENVFISGVYLQNCGDNLHRGDRRVALHLQVRANSLGIGFG
jgi:hypothetical protein